MADRSCKELRDEPCAETEEQSESLRAASTKLTKRELELFELCYVADLSTAEIAEEMGIKLQSVRRRKHALVKKLQGFLELPQT